MYVRQGLELHVLLLGCVSLVEQQPIVIKLSCEQSLELFSALWKNGGSDPDAIWHHRSDRSRDEAGSGVWGSVHGNGYLESAAQLVANTNLPNIQLGTTNNNLLTEVTHYTHEV